ncbi:MAG: hypothetical protein JXK04_09120 [Campylobacterales bacterium]|nr:hypothetical protein [Campylobacterales bacterium]
MQTERKKILQYALDHEIGDVHTYSGYRGDLIVKITTKQKASVLAIREFALSLGVKEVIVKQNTVEGYEIYCVTPDENVYGLKAGDGDDTVNHSEYIEDTWTKTTLN